MTSLQLPFIDSLNPEFPPVNSALEEPDGLLAFGGNLHYTTLLKAYRQGIFPWYEQNQPILWWCPKQRAIFQPGDIHISRSLQKIIRQQQFTLTSDSAFQTVLKHCAAPRQSASDTWITPAMISAYSTLHNQGFAHSIEVWHESELAGGLYGVAVGGVFCGESMFSKQPNASKFALVALQRTLFNQGFGLIDCQLENPHLRSMGCTITSRDSFIERLNRLKDKSCFWPKEFNSA